MSGIKEHLRALDAVGHGVTLENEVRTVGYTTDAHGNQWADKELSGRSRNTCSCGLDTGWVPRADADQTIADHAAEHAPGEAS